MTTIHTTVREGRIDVPAPDDYPDGTEVVLILTSAPASIDEDEAETEDIAGWLREHEALDPLEFTEEELAESEADRQRRKEWEKSQFNDRADRLAKLWE